MINSNGELSFIELAESSGDSSFDSAATRAVQQANPLNPLPRFNKSVLVVNATFNSILLPRVAKSKYQNRSHAEELAYSMGNARRGSDQFSTATQEQGWIEEDGSTAPVQRASVSRRATMPFTTTNEAAMTSNSPTRSSQNLEDKNEHQRRSENQQIEKAASNDLKYIAPERLQYCTEDQIERYLAQLHEFLQRPVTLPLR
jgi:TonB family protein